jgi:hypothetical protein
MKDITSKELKTGLPVKGPIEAADLIDYCFEYFSKDKTKKMDDYVIGGLTYEELICALLVARDNLNPWDCKHCNKRMLNEDAMHISPLSEVSCCSQHCLDLFDKNVAKRAK